MKHLWISGLKLHQLEERYPTPLGGLKWEGEIPPAYSFHVFKKDGTDRGIVACSDAFGGGLSWARFEGKFDIVGKDMPPFDVQEIEFLKSRYPKFLDAINNLDA